MSEFRKDPVINSWVIINSERRPIRNLEVVKPKVAELESCPFCENNEYLTPPEIMAYGNSLRFNQPGWTVRVIPNKFPILKIEESLSKKGEGLYDKITGIGANEIIIETPIHNIEFFELENKQLEDIFTVYRERLCDLRKDLRLEYILIFKNKGFRAGANIEHSHSQLVGLPIIPRRINEEINGATKYYEYKSRCVFCDIIDEELRVNKRVVYENADFVAICPYASKVPFEICILPKEHEAHYCNIRKNQIISLADIMKNTLKKLDLATGGAHYNYILHDSPIKKNDEFSYHWHIEIVPRMFQVAGFEAGAGIFVNSVPPEVACEYMRSLT